MPDVISNNPDSACNTKISESSVDLVAEGSAVARGKVIDEDRDVLPSGAALVEHVIPPARYRGDTTVSASPSVLLNNLTGGDI